MFDQELEITLAKMVEYAKANRHEFLTVEHLLLGLLSNHSAEAALNTCGGDIGSIRMKLEAFVNKTTPVVPIDVKKDTQPTLGFQRVLQRAIFRAQVSGRKSVSGADVLLAVFDEQASRGAFFLEEAHVSRKCVENYIMPRAQQPKHAAPSMAAESSPASFGMENNSEERGGTAGPQKELEQFTTNLNMKAKLDKIDPLIGRENITEEMIQILCRRQKNNPLLVGEPGVGKTAIVEGLARLIVEHKVPDLLSHSTIYSLDIGALMAGTRFRGDFEQRLKGVLEGIARDPGAILFIDEIHTIVGAGATSGGTMDLSNLLKPLLTSGDLKCVGATTYQEYRTIFEKEKALARRFQKIDVPEPTVEQTIHILKGLKSRFEKHHGVRYTDEALEAAVDLSARYITDRFLPDKAIDVVDEAGAVSMLQPLAERTGVIDRRAIEKVVAKIARIPEDHVSESEKFKIKNLELGLKKVVFGQDEAIDALVAAIKLSRSGLRETNKPIGSFLFAGPTGVGKTEAAKQLSRILGIDLLRFDMSEYMERHAVSRLIGAPPGYVGFDQGGLLTEEVNKHPYSVLLLDEVEKAHSDIYNVLLQVMDNGTLTDSSGRTTDFRHVILIMTTNAGAMEMSRPSIGFTTPDHSTDDTEAIQQVFSPEFRNRLDAIIHFQPLGFSTITHVVNKFIDELSEQLRKRGVSITVGEEARVWLAEHGYDKQMGARPMARVFQEYLKKPLADELLFGKLSDGGDVHVTSDGKQLQIQVRESVS